MNTKKRPAEKADLPELLPYSEDLSVLAEKAEISGHTIPNRICYQPMEGADGTREGAPAELTVRRYHRFARGGAGLIWFEATAILAEGRANPYQMYLTEQTADAFASLIEQIKSICLKENGYEPVIVCQLTHSGRYSKPDGTPAPMIAHNKPHFEKDKPIDPSRIVSDSYLEALTERYAASALLCRKVGFDGADIKACHGYLLSELLNSYLREGAYGGSYENRTRLFFDAVKQVSSLCGEDFIVASRFNAYDGYPHPYGIGDSGTPGIPDLGEAARISRDLESHGARLLNITMGNPYTNNEVNRPTTLAKTEMPYVSIERMLAGARCASEAAKASLVVCSGLSFLGALAPQVAAGGIKEGMFSLAGFGRQIFAYPDLARDILQNGEMKKDTLCLTCGKCTELMRFASGAGCAVWDREIYGKMYNEIKK